MNKSLKLNDVIISDAVMLLKRFTDSSIQLIIADPPYGIGYHSNHYKNKNPHAPVANDWNFQIASFLQECERVLINRGALYLFSRWDVSPLWLPSIAISNLKLKTKIIWVKNNWSAGDLKGSFGNQYEEILFITKGRHKLRGKRWPNVWNFSRVSSFRMLHPTQKPVRLLERAILSSSDCNDLVVDPFGGSGSTGEAAKLSGRQFLLGDINPKMVNIARARLGIPLLKIDEKTNTSQSEYNLVFPSPEEWGIHPEDVRFIYDQLKGNIESNLIQSTLFDTDHRP